MAEPEDVIAEGALHATRLARELWARRNAGAPGPPRLSDLRRRLELITAALFPGAPEIGVADPPAPLSFLARLARRPVAHLASDRALPSTDGQHIRLPPVLDGIPPAEVVGRYRLLALEQAARAARGTPALLPTDDVLLRDLYLLSEAAAVDRLLAGMLPRLTEALRDARTDALTGRADARRATACERAVEALTRTLLAADPRRPPAPFVVALTPAASLAWAEGHQRELKVLTHGVVYRGMAPVGLWGSVAPSPEPLVSAAADGHELDSTAPGRSRTLPRRPRVREAAPDEDDPTPGTWMVRADDLQEKAEDPAGLQRPADRDQDADPGELADALSELPEARLVRRPGRPREILAGEDPIRRALATTALHPGPGLAYPEWDCEAGVYRPRAAIVRERLAVAGDEAWVAAGLKRHAALVRRVRRGFERLRPRRTPLRRQRDGVDLDIDALVAAHADRVDGSMADDRFYIDTRPLRRDVAIALLVDTSASTDGWVQGDRRIIDVEKEALLVVAEALTALGDPYAITAFSSEGPARVDIRTIKSFDGRAGAEAVRRRIAALEPGGFTRVGAALRHVTACLMRQSARHRLLLLLSDGRPNDVDRYEGRYGIEDTRVAVTEARLQGVHCFCLTVDREAPRYASRTFGRHYAVLSRAERLPAVLTALLGELVRG